MKVKVHNWLMISHFINQIKTRQCNLYAQFGVHGAPV